MIDALQIATSGLNANQAWIDTISNNVANMQTAGFKKSQVSFQNLVQAQDTVATSDAASPATATGVGVKMGPSSLVFTTGDTQQTNAPLDLAIQGTGFFEVALTSGQTAYTRLGNFHINNERQLALPDGETLTADIRIPPNAQSVQIQPDGTVQITVSASANPVTVGNIRLATFAQPEFLQQLGSGLYAPTTQSGVALYTAPGATGSGLLLSGHLEMSNVDLVTEMTDLVMAQRAYQLNARILQASDQILETINNIRR